MADTHVAQQEDLESDPFTVFGEIASSVRALFRLHAKELEGLEGERCLAEWAKTDIPALKRAVCGLPQTLNGKAFNVVDLLTRVKRSRGTIASVALKDQTDRAWKKNVGGQLVTLYGAPSDDCKKLLKAFEDRLTGSNRNYQRKYREKKKKEAASGAPTDVPQTDVLRQELAEETSGAQLQVELNRLEEELREDRRKRLREEEEKEEEYYNSRRQWAEYYFEYDFDRMRQREEEIREELQAHERRMHDQLTFFFETLKALVGRVNETQVTEEVSNAASAVDCWS